jgi:hypothetical protein
MAWYDINYQYKKQITIDHTKVLADFTDFTILLHTTDANLKDMANGGHVQSSSGYDIIFTDSTETIRLDHEIEYYLNTQGKIDYWVNVPSLSSTADTIIFMYYGRAGVGADPSTTDAWDTNFVAVYHMADASDSANCHDSTVNANHGTWHGDLPTRDDNSCKTDRCQYLDGTGDYISLPDNCHINYQHTIESFFKLIDIDKEGNIIHYSRDSAVTNLTMFSQYGHPNHFYDSIGLKSGAVQWDIYPALPLPNTNWNNWTFAMNTNDAVSILNGASIGTDAICAIPIGNPVGSVNNIGMHPDGVTRPLYGWIDEFRISNIRRTNNWIFTTYNNENSPSTFMSFGGELEYGACAQYPSVPTTMEIDDDSCIINGISYDFMFVSTCIYSDIKYGIDWNGDGVVDEWTGFYASGVEVTISHAFPTDGIVHITVLACDSDGCQTAYATDLIINVVHAATNLCNCFLITSASYTFDFPLPDWDNIERYETKEIDIFDFYNEDFDTTDNGIGSRSLMIGGTLWIDNITGGTYVTCTNECLCVIIEYINNIQNNHEEITITGIDDLIDAVYIFESFKFSSINRTNKAFDWSMTLKKVRDI